jgi:hypothetical protein
MTSGESGRSGAAGGCDRSRDAENSGTGTRGAWTSGGEGATEDQDDGAYAAGGAGGRYDAEESAAGGSAWSAGADWAEGTDGG